MSERQSDVTDRQIAEHRSFTLGIATGVALSGAVVGTVFGVTGIACVFLFLVVGTAWLFHIEPNRAIKSETNQGGQTDE